MYALKQLLVQMLLYIILRTADGAKHCSVYADISTSRDNTGEQSNDNSSGINEGGDRVCLESDVWGHFNELTGPAAWRRVVSSYQRCEKKGPSKYPLHHKWPTRLFNQVQINHKIYVIYFYVCINYYIFVTPPCSTYFTHFWF